MQAYNREFAKVFNNEFSGFIIKVTPIIERFYSSTDVSASNKHVLDLCCGTGQLVKNFLRNGYSVVGVDGSEFMLIHARENNQDFYNSGKIELINGDILKQRFDQQFGLVTCTYDSINHLNTEQELFSCFELVYKSLVKGGYFIFDINTKLSLFNWNTISMKETSNALIISRGIYDGRGPKATIKFSGFLRKYNGFYERFEQVIYNSVFETQMIKKYLLEIGWSKVYFSKIENLSLPIDEPENIDKENELFVVACK